MERRREGEKTYKGSIPCIISMKTQKKRKHNFEIEDDIWEEFQIYCIRKKKPATKIIAEYIKKLVKNYKKK